MMRVSTCSALRTWRRVVDEYRGDIGEISGRYGGDMGEIPPDNRLIDEGASFTSPCWRVRTPMYALYLPYISPISPLYLPCSPYISHALRRAAHLHVLPGVEARGDIGEI